MKVYFTHSTTDSRFFKYYQAVAQTVERLGHELTHHRSGFSQTNHDDIGHMSEQYSGMMRSIIGADVCIFDTSIQSVRVGHQLTYALENSTPVLLLAHNSSGEQKDFFIAGSKSGYLNIKFYESTHDLKDSVEKFLTSGKIRKTRFNIAIENNFAEFIEQKSNRDNMSKTDVIRTALSILKEHEENTGESAFIH